MVTVSLESVSSAVRAVSRLLCAITLPLPKYPAQSSVSQLRSPDLQLSPVELGIAPIWIAQPPMPLPVNMPYMGDRMVLVAEWAGSVKRMVNSMTSASAKLASFLTEFIIDYVEHALILTEQADVVLDVRQE